MRPCEPIESIIISTGRSIRDTFAIVVVVVVIHEDTNDTQSVTLGKKVHSIRDETLSLKAVAGLSAW